MNWQYTPLVFPLFIPATITIWLAFYAWKRRPAVGVTPFVVAMLAVAEWSLVYALRLSSIDLPDKLFWAKVRYLGIVTVPTAWLIFVLQYTGREKWLTVRNVAMLALEPLVVLLLIWTNDWHHLYWNSVSLVTSGPLSLWSASYGMARWIHVAYTYGVLLLGIFLLARVFVRSPHPYREQAGVLLIGVLTPLAADAVSAYGLIPLLLDLTPFAFTVTGLTMAWGIFQFQLFDIVPVARNAIIDSMSDGVLVLDTQNRVVDINPAAENIIGHPSAETLGQPIAGVLADRPELLDHFRGVTEARAEISLGKGKARRSYDLRISPLREQRDHLIGQLIVLHDITERKRAEANTAAQKRLFESLVAMARAVAKQPSMEATLQNALNMSATLTGAENGSIFLLDGREVVTHCVLARDGVAPLQQHNIVSSVMEEGLAGWVVRHRRPALVRDTLSDDRWLALSELPYTVRSAMAVPVVSGSAVLGVLTLMHPEPNHFTTNHTYLIQSASDQIMMALRNAQMYDGQRRLANRQTLLYEALRAVGEHIDLETIARAAVEAVARLTGWPAVSLLLPDETNSHLIVRAAAGALAATEGQRLSIAQGIDGRAFRTAQTQHAPDVSTDPDYVEAHPAHRSELAVPLRRGERVLGVLDVASDLPAAFIEDDILLAKSLAEAIALALDNAQLYAETRQYADAIAKERSRLQALIESSRDGIILIGMDQRMLVVNAPALTLLHLAGRPEDWVNQPIQDALAILKRHAPRARQAILNELRRTQMGDEPPGEGEFDVPPRKIHWLNLSVMTGETPLGRLVMLRDVTEERLLERMRDDLTHTMVHDLRNPLTAISGAISLLDKRLADTFSPSQRQLWDIAQTNTGMMLKLVSAILDISRLESQQMPLEHTLISLSDLVTDVLETQLLLAADKGLDIESDVPPTLPPVWADEGLVKRVLHNLVGNAIKFTPDGGTVRVTARTEASDRARILVSVSDTGSGIPAEIQDRLFQKFVTGEQKERGSGLGLAFCRMVIEAHNERIWVESTFESGATFSFTLSPPPAMEA
ncbi:MAG: histidine kinase N-terminal 7TM domain-containing protein [Chloroflexota bacterium]|nr:histidine kinase N-terminal 7TM domain-containing protein [Chloroflexota bacterium]